MDSPLNIPKKHPKASNKYIKFLFFNSFGIATKKESLFIYPDSEAGVGG